jgi:chromosome condensin MukBEF MukE localization factor
MPEKIQPNDVLRYLYKETSPEESARIEQFLFGNQQLEDEFYNFMDLKKELDQMANSHSPKKSTIDKILKYSKSLGVASMNEHEK